MEETMRSIAEKPNNKKSTAVKKSMELQVVVTA
jgi:hypothetical protein